MKMRKWIYAAMVCGLAACGRGRVTAIEGNVSGVNDATVYVAGLDGYLDSVQVRQGKFSVTVPHKKDDVFFIHFWGRTGLGIPVVADGGTVAVSGNAVRPDELAVSGSPANDLLQQYRSTIYRHDMMLRAISLEMGEVDPSGADSLHYRALAAKTDSISAAWESLRGDFVRENNASPVAAFLVYIYAPGDATRPQADSMLRLVDTTAHNAFVDRLRALRQKPSGR